MSEVGTLGFWKHGARYLSGVVHKGQIPKWCRLELVKNAYKKTDKHPDYIGYFVPAKEDERVDVDKPLATLRKQESNWERSDELFDLIRSALIDIRCDAEPDDECYGGILSAVRRIEGALNELEEE